MRVNYIKHGTLLNSSHSHCVHASNVVLLLLRRPKQKCQTLMIFNGNAHVYISPGYLYVVCVREDESIHVNDVVWFFY